MLADNLIDLETGELMIDWCAFVLDNAGHGAGGTRILDRQGRGLRRLYRIADRCVQILGGTGVTDDAGAPDLPRYPRLPASDGPTEVHKWSLARRSNAGEGVPSERTPDPLQSAPSSVSDMTSLTTPFLNTTASGRAAD